MLHSPRVILGGTLYFRQLKFIESSVVQIKCFKSGSEAKTFFFTFVHNREGLEALPGFYHGVPRE